jgi:hypothetical protein
VGSEDEYPANSEDEPTYLFSNGDADGHTGHAEFMNGWKTGILQRVIDECSDLGFGNTNLCPVFEDLYSRRADIDASTCRYSQPIPDEDVGLGAPITQLPNGKQVRDAGTVVANTTTSFSTNVSDVQFVLPSRFMYDTRPGGLPIV